MRRSICFCEPSAAMAGQVDTWKFVYKPSASLPKGTKLKFDLLTQGRSIDWEVPRVGAKLTTNTIFAKVEGGKALIPKEVETPESFVPQYEFTLPAKLEAGKAFTITVGNVKPAKKASGIAAQTYTQRRRPFHLFIDPTGKGHYRDPEVFSIDIRGNELSNVRVISPSFVMKNRRFDAIIRFEDEFGNLTSNATEELLFELTHENLRDSLSWKLFVPETGFITLPNLYFNEEGVYTIFLRNMQSDETFRSAPVRCFHDNAPNLYWGLLHGESERIDSTENIENCLRHIRDDQALNFYGTSSFENAEETPNDMWKLISQNVLDFDEDDRFTTFLGFQWVGAPSTEGVRHIIHAKDNKPVLRKKETKNNSLKKIYRSFNPGEILSIPSFTMGKGYEYNFKNFNPDFERVVEIYNSWGSSECTKKEGNELSIGVEKGGKGIKESAEGSIQKALNANLRFGFVAGGLDDRGPYGPLYEGGQLQYPPGMTGIVAKEQSRDALFQALMNRSCYATTGERMIVGLYLAGAPMGSELNSEEKPGLVINRHLSGFVAGTEPLASVEIIRNGKVIKTLSSENYFLDIEYDDMEPLEKATIPGGGKESPFAYYYLRVTQDDGHMAWSSPIWVDYIKPAKKVAKK